MKALRALVEPQGEISMRRQCALLGVSWSSLYYEAVEPDSEELALMRRVDELHLEHPFFGSRLMTRTRKGEGFKVNRKRMQRLMRVMGLESVAPKPNASKAALEHPRIRESSEESEDNSGQPGVGVRRFLFLVAIIDLYSRRVLAWRSSNSLQTRFYLEALHEALEHYSRPEIFNTDQGAQFTSERFHQRLARAGNQGEHGRPGPLPRQHLCGATLAFDEVRGDVSVRVRDGSGGPCRHRSVLDFFNNQRPHSALGNQPLACFYDGLRNEVS